MEQGKLIIISAPSGAGKSTIIGRIMEDESLRLVFSVSATTPAGARNCTEWTITS